MDVQLVRQELLHQFTFEGLVGVVSYFEVEVFFYFVGGRADSDVRYKIYGVGIAIGGALLTPGQERRPIRLFYRALLVHPG